MSNNNAFRRDVDRDRIRLYSQLPKNTTDSIGATVTRETHIKRGRGRRHLELQTARPRDCSTLNNNVSAVTASSRHQARQNTALLIVKGVKTAIVR